MENNEWVSFESMNQVRYLAAETQLQDGKILVTGGYNYTALNKAEILTEEGWDSKVPSLPVPIFDHCMVTLNSTTVMAISGGSVQTFYYTIGDESWIKGPELQIKRARPSCGKIRREKNSQEMSIIVVGGFDKGYEGDYYDYYDDIKSVEILDEGSNEWRTGPELSFGIQFSQLVEDRNGGVVLIGGQSDLIGNLDTLFQLPHGGPDADWIEMEQKLNPGRRYHTAFLVPDSVVDCS